jgi:hypothetical protein
MSWDGARRRILFLAADNHRTWEWDGTTWTERTPPASPPGGTMAYDSVRQRAVLFGGAAETWEWDGTTWSRPAAAAALGSPDNCIDGNMVYDDARQRVVLFGRHCNSSSSATWEWDGNTWSELRPARGPNGRTGASMAYDAARHRVVLYGGSPVVVVGWGVDALSDTWEWDGANWTQLTPPTSPPARTDARMAYDVVRQRVVLFGGYGIVNWSAVYRSDTWEWDGTTWTQVPTVVTPPPRLGAGMTYDAAHERVVLFGGYTGESTDGGGVLGDTWQWDGRVWTESTPTSSPPAAQKSELAYDLSRQRVVLFGGCNEPAYLSINCHADTWEWDGTTWTQLQLGFSPPPNPWPKMTYDLAHARLVLVHPHSMGTWFLP